MCNKGPRLKPNWQVHKPFGYQGAPFFFSPRSSQKMSFDWSIDVSGQKKGENAKTNLQKEEEGIFIITLHYIKRFIFLKLNSTWQRVYLAYEKSFES